MEEMVHGFKKTKEPVFVDAKSRKPSYMRDVYTPGGQTLFRVLRVEVDNPREIGVVSTTVRVRFEEKGQRDRFHNMARGLLSGEELTITPLSVGGTHTLAIGTREPSDVHLRVLKILNGEKL